MVKVLYGPQTETNLKHSVENLELFQSPVALITHMNAEHGFLPTNVFVDLLKQASNLPTVTKPTELWLKNQKEYNGFTSNLFQDISTIENGAIFGENNDETRARNHAFLIYVFGAISLQLDRHLTKDIEFPETLTARKFVALDEYLKNLILMVSKDEFEVCGNGECLTEDDRIALAKFHLINLLIGQIIQK